jgi:amidase
MVSSATHARPAALDRAPARATAVQATETATAHLARVIRRAAVTVEDPGPSKAEGRQVDAVHRAAAREGGSGAANDRADGPAMFAPFLLIPSLFLAQAATSPPIKFEPTAGVPTFAVRDPVLRLQPGAIVETRTFSKPGDYYDRAGGPWPGEVGPFWIEGATPNDTLVVRILKLRPNRDFAVSQVNPNGISAVAADSRTRMLNDPLPARRFVWRLDRARNVGILDLPGSASKSIEMPLKPMLGRLAVAPAGEEAFGGLWPGNFGGNMDASDAREGTTVYLPIFHDGALFYFGDGHALQGDGEIVGSGLETTMDVTFQFDLVKGRRIRWPRMEDADDIMVAGSVRPLVDAFRIAQVELIEWLVDEYGFERMEAYQVVSQGGHSRIANVVDPNYTVVAKFPKKLLPSKKP